MVEIEVFRNDGYLPSIHAFAECNSRKHRLQFTIAFGNQFTPTRARTERTQPNRNAVSPTAPLEAGFFALDASKTRRGEGAYRSYAPEPGAQYSTNTPPTRRGFFALDASKTRRGEGAYRTYATEPQRSIAKHIRRKKKRCH